MTTLFQNEQAVNNLSLKNIHSCNLCPFAKKRIQPVLGYGSPTAKLVIIGEAPTEKENEKGYPFLETAGELLKNYLIPKLNLSMNDIYWTYAIKCYKGNLNIKTVHIQNCRKFLLEELSSINPDYIITLGKIPYIALFDKNPTYNSFPLYEIYQLNGKNITVFATYSLEYVLKKFKRIPLIMKDFEHFGRRIANNPIKWNFQYKIITSWKDLEDWVNNKLTNLVAVDIETASLHSKIITGIGFCCEENEAIFIPMLRKPIEVTYKEKKELIKTKLGADLVVWDDYTWEGIDSVLKYILGNKKIRKIFHGGNYDIKILTQNGYQIENYYFDTMVATPLIDENINENLKDLAYLYLNFPKYDKALTEYKKKLPADLKKNYEYLNIPLDVLGKYCAADVNATFRLHNIYINIMRNQMYENLFYKICMPLRQILTRAEIRGIKINRQKVRQLHKEYSQKLEELEQKIYEYAGKKFNINSSEQLGDVLFRKLGLPIQKFTATQQPSTDASNIEAIEHLHPICSLILEYKNLMKLKTTYLEGMVSLADENDILHTHFKVNGTETGRLTSSEPNLQNIPRKSDIRTIFCARDGYSLITADFDQAELRILAAFSQDPALIEAFQKGKDIHRFTAGNFIYHKPLDQVTSEERATGKTINFGIVYQMTKKGLSKRLKISEEQAQAIIDAWYQGYKYAGVWIQQTKEFILQNRYIYNVFGRMRRFPYFDLERNKDAILREGVNFPIQSTCADMTSIATIRNDKICHQFKLINADIVLNVHDELIYEVKDNLIEEFVGMLKQSMEQPYFDSPVKFPVDINIMKEWQKK